MAKISLMWAYAHEVFHYLRRHELVAKHFGGDTATRHALEFDADMCAIAAVYRYLQYFSARISAELDCKRKTIAHLFWCLRMEADKASDGDFAGSDTHPHAAARIYDLIGKLAMMQDMGPADTHCARPATRLHHGKLLEVLFQLEAAYMGESELKPDMLGKSKVLDFGTANVELRYTSERHKRWDEISPLIEKFASLPRGIVNNEARIAFFVGNHMSLPRVV